MKNFLARRPVQIALVLFALLAAALFLSGQFRLAERFALAQNRAKWSSQNIANYSFQVEALCFCPILEPMTVQVRNGVPVSTNPIEINSVEDLFQIAQNALAKAARVSIAYDAAYGFPSYIAIDNIRQMVDDEVNYKVTDFQILP